MKAWGWRRVATGSGWSRGGGRGPHVVAERRARGGCRTGRDRRRAACAAASVSARDEVLELVRVEQPAERMAAPRPSCWSGSIRGEIRFMALMAPSWRPGSWDESGRRPSADDVVDRPASGRLALWTGAPGAEAGMADAKREYVAPGGYCWFFGRLCVYLFSTPRSPSRGASVSAPSLRGAAGRKAANGSGDAGRPAREVGTGGPRRVGGLPVDVHGQRVDRDGDGADHVRRSRGHLFDPLA